MTAAEEVVSETLILPEILISPCVVEIETVDGGAILPIVPVNVKLSVALTVKPYAPSIVPEIVCSQSKLLILASPDKVIAPE